PRFSELDNEEVVDIFETVQKVSKVIEKEYNAESMTLTIQDGPSAGQTVPHFHVHIIPRRKGDFANNDDIYNAIDEKSKEALIELQKKKVKVDNENRKARTQDEMAKESEKLRLQYFKDCQFEDIWSS
ncbi:hypothetical protein HK099_003005, partial [Clydaea vesicula]